MHSLPIPIPVAAAVSAKPSLPILAALVPVAAGVVLWLVTGSLYSLCFAALGPLMLLAGLFDGSRARRSARRRAEAEEERGWAKAEEELEQRHDAERARRRHRDPDVAQALVDPPLKQGDRPGIGTPVVVGSGTRGSSVRAAGGEGERAREFQERCARIEGAPVTVPLGRGIALRGAPVLTEAAVRALVLQLCLRFSASQLALIGPGLDDLGLATVPHSGGSTRSGFRLGVVRGGMPVPDTDAMLCLLAPSDPVPDGIVCVVDITDAGRATVRTSEGLADVAPEFLSRMQAGEAARRFDPADPGGMTLPDGLALAELSQTPSATTLPATIGRGGIEDVVLDIVEDGPHAIVTGTTGSGKSELLVSWVAALATQHGPDRVVFVLADFKGGTAFDPLRALPHVVAVITDLDQSGARRGVSSLSAELRRRESVLAAAGARDIADVALPRLVIVVDEFAALLHEHPDLGAVFTDIAARGRALGMHLILGTQRAVGVVRDGLAANCPLRVSLRVGDAADSRAVIGSDAAAEIVGGVESRGLAFARRPRDAQARMLRVARTGSQDVVRIAERWRSAPAAQSPWLAPLPTELPLADVRTAAPSAAVVLGRADLPDRQDQPLEHLRIGEDRGLAIIGQSGSGRSSALRAIEAQCSGSAVRVPAHPESAWDVVSALATGPGAGSPPEVVLCDDLDAQLDAFPPEHAAEFAQLWERLLRSGTRTTFVMTAGRAHGATGRILDLLPRRALLRLGGRTEHLAAGGDAEGYLRDRPPGRARIDDREMQFAWVPEQRLRSSRVGRSGSSIPSWEPRHPLTALVSAGSTRVAAELREAYPTCTVRAPAEVVSMLREGISSGESPVLVVGDAETWQREWPLWQRIREDGELLIRAENAAELRQLAGIRTLPPFALPHAGRAWAIVGAEPPRRVLLDPLAPRA